MVSYPIENYINERSWQKALNSYWQKPVFQELLARLEKRCEEAVIYPPKALWYEAFNRCPLAQCKVLILGQDPYHGPGQAHGLSFSVPMGQKLPPSLRNIFKELKLDLGIEPALSGDLSAWADQGVLLLNSALTVEESQAGAHKNWGWEDFSNEVIRVLAEQESPISFILWGNWAKTKAEFIPQERHQIIQSAHPSPLSARHGFFNSKPFSKVNAFLTKQGKEAINWQLPW